MGTVIPAVVYRAIVNSIMMKMMSMVTMVAMMTMRMRRTQMRMTLVVMYCRCGGDDGNVTAEVP